MQTLYELNEQGAQLSCNAIVGGKLFEAQLPNTCTYVKNMADEQIFCTKERVADLCCNQSLYWYVPSWPMLEYVNAELIFRQLIDDVFWVMVNYSVWAQK